MSCCFSRTPANPPAKPHFPVWFGSLLRSRRGCGAWQWTCRRAPVLTCSCRSHRQRAQGLFDQCRCVKKDTIWIPLTAWQIDHRRRHHWCCYRCPWKPFCDWLACGSLRKKEGGKWNRGRTGGKSLRWIEGGSGKKGSRSHSSSHATQLGPLGKKKHFPFLNRVCQKR